jgi:peptidoglycan/xylan/chitin deacetylase (PgdA/CDA1 family)
MTDEKYSTIFYFVFCLLLVSISIVHFLPGNFVKALQHNNPKSQTDPLLGADISNGITTTTISQGTKILQTSLHYHTSSSLSAPAIAMDHTNNNLTKKNEKVAILTFDDGFKTEFTLAKPILDKYNFKATFFVVCDYVERGANNRMDWEDVLQLHNEGHDIEAHTMDHKDLTTLPLSQVGYEVGQSKQCLADHGINSTIFSYPFSKGWDNLDIVNTVNKYFSMARANGFPLMFLHCDGFKSRQQTDCRTFTNGGMLTFANKYSIRSWAHQHLENGSVYDDTQMFEKFIQVVNSQDKYNKGGKIDAIPIITYHDITYQDTDYLNGPYNTNADLFDKEMKYLHDNNFKVITMSNLAYDENNNSFYLIQ